MKRKLFTMIAAVLIITLLAACGTPAVPKSNETGAANSEAPAKSTSAEPNTNSGTAAGTPSEGYVRYTELKGKSYDRLTAAMDKNTDLAMYGLSLMPVVMVDLSLIPLTVLTADPGAGATALEMLGMANVKVQQNGAKYTITYADKDGNKSVQTCEYDAAADSMQSLITDGTGKEVMFFEFVKVGTGYASQYYMSEEGGYSKITSFFDDANITAYGIEKTDTKPASIFKNGPQGEDFVKNGEFYMILKDGKMTVSEKGAEKTY